MAKTLATFLFGNEDALITVDMSEYMERFAVSRLTGAPPGYVGYNEGGQLTEQVRRRPYSVVLFDEIEKAHPDIFNALLQVLEEGQMTDATGRRVDFRNTVIIMTSNVGARRIGKGGGTLGFQRDDQESLYQKMKERVIEEAKKVFNPEFMNRLDDTLVFHRLTDEQLIDIVDIQVKDMVERVAAKGVHLRLRHEAKEFLVRLGSNEEYGARPLRRAVQSYIEDPLAELLLRGNLEPGTKIEVWPSDTEDKLVFEQAELAAEGITT
jgi:ATP-dependent Clp protease ATP-binding subunit ClpC